MGCGIVYTDSKTYHRSQKGVRKNERETKRNNDDHVDRNQYSSVYCSYHDRTDRGWLFYVAAWSHVGTVYYRKSGILSAVYQSFSAFWNLTFIK